MEYLITEILDTLKNENDLLDFINDANCDILYNRFYAEYFDHKEYNVEELLNEFIKKDDNDSRYYSSILEDCILDNNKIFYTYHLKEGLTYLDLPVEFLYDEFITGFITYDNHCNERLYKCFIEAFALKKEIVNLRKL